MSEFDCPRCGNDPEDCDGDCEETGRFPAMTDSAQPEGRPTKYISTLDGSIRHSEKPLRYPWVAAQPPAVTRPGTEAGRLLFDRFDDPGDWDVRDAILAIEAEARYVSPIGDTLREHIEERRARRDSAGPCDHCEAPSLHDDPYADRMGGQFP